MNRPLPSDTDLQPLWMAFCKAAQTAQGSLKIEDGIAAGKAWRAWLSQFAPPIEADPSALPEPMPAMCANAADGRAALDPNELYDAYCAALHFAQIERIPGAWMAVGAAWERFFDALMESDASDHPEHK